jgi:hypothetical protein
MDWKNETSSNNSFERNHIAKRRQVSHMTKSRGILGTAIILYFVIALEVLIMISPFAAFFYVAFNPVLLWFAHWPATR